MRVPLAWRNLTADGRRLAISMLGIGFAVLLMLMQLGFRNALVDSQVEIIRQLQGDLVIVSAAKYQLNRLEPFPRRRLHQALAVNGVASASPVYLALPSAMWKNPDDRSQHRIRVLGVDPDDPVFASPGLAAQVSLLRTPDTVLADARCRSHLGRARPGETTEVTQRKVTIAGEFSLGTDFLVDGTLITSDRTFFNLFPDYRAVDSQLNRVEIGLLSVESGRSVADVLTDLHAQLPPDVKAMTREELIDLERTYWMRQSPVGLVFNLGTVVGFIVGIVICSQILFTDLSEKMPQFATLKAIGYRNSYLRGIVLKQAFLLALFGFVPGVLGSWLLYQVIGRLSGLLMRMGTDLVAIVFVLTVVMCLLSGMVSVRKVLNADPAEVF